MKCQSYERSQYTHYHYCVYLRACICVCVYVGACIKWTNTLSAWFAHSDQQQIYRNSLMNVYGWFVYMWITFARPRYNWHLLCSSRSQACKRESNSLLKFANYFSRCILCECGSESTLNCIRTASINQQHVWKLFEKIRTALFNSRKSFNLIFTQIVWVPLSNEKKEL